MEPISEKKKSRKQIQILLLGFLCLTALFFVFVSERTLADEAGKEAASSGGEITLEEWNAFVPAFQNVPQTLKATKKKVIKTNAPEGVSVKWSVTNTKRAFVSQKGVLKGKRVGYVRVKATFTAKVEGKLLEKTLKSPKIRIRGKKLIFIDAGHQQYANLEQEPLGPGSSETKMKVSGGCVGYVTGIPEYEFTLRIAKKLRTALLNNGYGVIMSRTKNAVNISNRERALKANQSGADICIRIHADSYENGSSVRGVSVLYASSDNPFPIGRLAKKSKKLASCLLSEYCSATGIASRGLYVRNDLSGLNWSKMPNVLIECGFFSNPEEDVYLNTAKTQKKIVKGMVRGINRYFGY